MASPSPPRLVLSCEHGGHRIPRRYRELFEGAERTLASHRGWDPGALPLARRIARRCAVPLLAVTLSRLVVDTNRSVGHPRVFSEWTRSLASGERAALLARYHAPHHGAVTTAVEALMGARQPAVHLSVHSFTPVLDGVERRVDLGLLYDPRRPRERAVADALATALTALLPNLRVRRNTPYRGVSDGLTKVMRARFPDRWYAGVELEINQRLLTSTGGVRRLSGPLSEDIAEAVAQAVGLAASAKGPPGQS